MSILARNASALAAKLGGIGKRAFDIAASAAGLLILAPTLLAVALAVKVSSPGPIIFRHRRVGLHGARFDVFKFRTMVDGAEALGRETGGTQDPRITRVGRFLRRTKLDELPQLVNVLRGQMSLVGPRPEIPHYADRYRGEDRIVLSVRPGITDPCSLEMSDLDEIMQTRGSTPPAEFYEREVQPRKLKLQREYITSHTFAGDIAILVRTVLRIVRR
ncbi:MAG: sugar transferase [Acidobacteria bacterium]|nr:sugar transferase [Acidobacteriota bacterium]